MRKLGPRISDAVRHFWSSRKTQAQRQGARTGVRDAGARAAVTGSAQMDGFVRLICDLLDEEGIEKASVHCEQRLELPGYFRPEKKWDLVVVIDGALIASIEFKSQVGPSFVNNYNNRTEEALGNATDILTAYREGAFKLSARPWLGYLFLLEEAPGSTTAVGVREPHFPVFPEFKGSSYAKRYEILLTKLVRERLYDSTCLLVSPVDRGRKGVYHEPNAELSFQNFAGSLLGHTLGYLKSQGKA